MGAVYEAEQEQPRRRVAVKVLNALASSPDALRRFEYESQNLARLRHANIAAVIEAGTHRHIGLSVPFYAMELVIDGQPITTYAEQQGLSIAQRLRLFIHVCEAVHHAHAQNVLHRDIKPSNILVDTDGNPKLIDFGISRALDAAGAAAATRMLTLTDPSQLLGTLQYMSPEQLAPEGKVDLDRRADVYALGLVLYELLCGRRPYDLADATVAQATRVVRDESIPRPGSINTQLGRDVETILLKALQKERSRRYASAAELAEDLRRALSGEAIQARRDSIGYGTRVRVRRVVGQQWMLATALVAVLAFLLGRLLGQGAEHFNAINRYERFVVSHIPYFPPGPLQHVVVVAMHDGTDFGQLAMDQGLVNVSNGTRASLRRLHGHLMQQLAGSEAKVVAWDIVFASPSEFDKDLLAGIDQLQQSGTRVVIAAPSWRTPPIPTSAQWAGATASSLTPDAVWSTHLAVQPQGVPTVPSLSLAAAAAYLWPSAALEYQVTAVGVDVVEVGQPQPRFVRASYADYITQSDPQAQLAEGDWAAHNFVAMPSDADLNSSTLDYAEVMCATPAQRSGWFKGKVVLVVDAQAGHDAVGTTPDGRQVNGFYANAVSAENVISGRMLTRAQQVNLLFLYVRSDIILGILGSAAAALLAVWLRRRFLRLGIAILALEIVAVAGALLAFRFAGSLYPPHVLMATILFSAAAAWVVQACRRPAI
jgi:CHASE2 domain-containing sensor protein